MGQYAKQTQVSIATSKAEIEHLVERYGATGYGSMWEGDKSAIVFQAKNRRVKFMLHMPREDDKKYERDSRGYRRPKGQNKKVWQQECRSLWRSLVLCIKAKLEAVDSEITTFDDEFMAHIVDPLSGCTIGEQMRPQIEAAYDRGEPMKLLT